MFNTKEQHTSQEDTRQNIINDMVKKRNSIVPESSLISMMMRGYCGPSLLSQFPFGVPLVFLELSYRPLKRFRCAFLDESRGRSTFGRLQGKKAEREEGLKVLRKYTLLTNIGSLVREACLLAPRRYVHETMNICGTMKSNKYSLF